MEALVALAQILCLAVIACFMIDFHVDFFNFCFINCALAMTSAAVAVVLGSSVDDPKLAAEMLPLLFVPQMTLAGGFVAPALIPEWLRWAQCLCSLTCAVRLMVLAELSECSEQSGAQTCDDVVRTVDANEDESF